MRQLYSVVDGYGEQDSPASTLGRTILKENGIRNVDHLLEMLKLHKKQIKGLVLTTDFNYVTIYPSTIAGYLVAKTRLYTRTLKGFMIYEINIVMNWKKRIIEKIHLYPHEFTEQ